MTANTPRTKKAKGTMLESRIAQMIRDKGIDPLARKTPRSGVYTGFEGDIHSTLPFTFEVKNHEHVRLWEFWKQAKKQEQPGKPAILIVGGNRKNPLACMDIDTFLDMVKIWN